MLALFEVDTGPYKKQKCGYRKRTGLCKRVVKQPLVETRISLLVSAIPYNTITDRNVFKKYFSAIIAKQYYFLKYFIA